MTRYTRSTLPGAMRVYRALVARGLAPTKPRWIGGPEPFAVDLPDTGPSEPATAPDAPAAPSPLPDSPDAATAALGPWIAACDRRAKGVWS